MALFTEYHHTIAKVGTFRVVPNNGRNMLVENEPDTYAIVNGVAYKFWFRAELSADGTWQPQGNNNYERYHSLSGHRAEYHKSYPDDMTDSARKQLGAIALKVAQDFAREHPEALAAADVAECNRDLDALGRKRNELMQQLAELNAQCIAAVDRQQAALAAADALASQPLLDGVPFAVA